MERRRNDGETENDGGIGTTGISGKTFPDLPATRRTFPDLKDLIQMEEKST